MKGNQDLDGVKETKPIARYSTFILDIVLFFSRILPLLVLHYLLVITWLFNKIIKKILRMSINLLFLLYFFI